MSLRAVCFCVCVSALESFHPFFPAFRDSLHCDNVNTWSSVYKALSDTQSNYEAQHCFDLEYYTLILVSIPHLSLGTFTPFCEDSYESRMQRTRDTHL